MKFLINFLFLSSLPLYCAQPADVQAELREKLRKRLERIEQQPPQAPAKKIVPPPAKKPVVKEEEKKAGAPPAKPVEPKAEEKKKVAEQKNIAENWNTIQSLLKKYSTQQPAAGKSVWDLFNSADWQAKEDIHSWDVPGKGSAWMIDPMFATLLDVYMTEYTSSNDRPTLVAIMGNIMPAVFGFGPAKDPAVVRAEQDKLQKVGPQTAAFLDPLIKARFGSVAPKPAAKPAAPAKKSEAERKVKEEADFASVENKYWGNNQELQKTWNELQELIKKNKAIRVAEWPETDWSRRVEIRGMQHVKNNLFLVNFESAYNAAIVQLDGAQREYLMTLVNYLASALLGDAKIPEPSKKILNDINTEIENISPKTKELADHLRLLFRVRHALFEIAPDEQKKIDECMSALRKKYLDELEIDRKKNMEIFFELTKMDEKKWNDYLIKIYPEYEKDVANYISGLRPYLPEATHYNLIQELLQQSGINPNSIKLLGWRNAPGPFNVYGDNIILKLPEADVMSLDIVRWSILHEIQHIKNEDNLTEFAMRKILAGSPYEEFMYLWTYFDETRADILALRDISAAYAYFSYFSGIGFLRFFGGGRHLHHEQRTAFARKLLEEVLQCYE